MKSWKLDRLGGILELVETDKPEVRSGCVRVRIHASLLMSYLGQYVAGELPIYSAPNRPFVPGGNAIGVIDEIGRDVWHLQPGQRVAVSPHFVAQENVDEPAQFLLGVTAFGETAKRMQAAWPDGTLSEYMVAPAHLITPLEALDQHSDEQLSFLLRLAVPYGGFLRARLAPGETVIVNGASGAYGSAAVLVALAMGASKVVAAGRNKAALSRVMVAGGDRVAAICLTGDVSEDAKAMRDATSGGAHLALDMVGNANDPAATLATLNGLRRGGRLALMGSMKGELPVPYLQLMVNNLELIGNFMHPRDAVLRLAHMVSAGILPITAFSPIVFGMQKLPEAMATAAAARNFDGVVLAPFS